MKQITKGILELCFIFICIFCLWYVGCKFLEKIPTINSINHSQRQVQIQEFIENGNHKIRVSVLRSLILKGNLNNFTREEALSFLKHQTEYKQLVDYILLRGETEFVEKYLTKKEVHLVIQNKFPLDCP